MHSEISRRSFRSLALALILVLAAGAQAKAEDVTVGDLTVSDAKLVSKSDHLDVYFTIKNNSKFDERLSGADSSWKNAGVVEMTKDKEEPVGEILPAGKSVEFTSGEKWLRLKEVKEPKETDIIPVSLFFRRSPNAVLHLALNPSKAEKAEKAAEKAVKENTKAAPAAASAAATATAPATTPGVAPAASDSGEPKKSSSFMDWFKK